MVGIKFQKSITVPHRIDAKIGIYVAHTKIVRGKLNQQYNHKENAFTYHNRFRKATETDQAELLTLNPNQKLLVYNKIYSSC